MELREVYIELIKAFECNKVRYCVLRGYEGLPNEYSNDIDFGIHPNDEDLFFRALSNLSSNSNINLVYRDSRYKVLKLKLLKNELSVDLDFWFGFNYLGLNYLDIFSMLDSNTTYNSFNILNLEDEVSLSFLKELLHMKRVRVDKVDSILFKMNKCNESVFGPYFSFKQKDLFQDAINNRRFDLKFLSFKIKLYLFYKNIYKHGIIHTFNQICLFIVYKILPSYNPLKIKATAI